MVTALAALWACTAGNGESVPKDGDSPGGDTAPDTGADTGDTGADSTGESGAETGVDTGPPGSDADGDGWTDTDGDCDDTRVNVYPGAPDGCDALDQDCDGEAIPEGACGERWDPAVSASWVITGVLEEANLQARWVSRPTDASGRDTVLLDTSVDGATSGGALGSLVPLAPTMTSNDLPIWHSVNSRDVLVELQDAGDVDSDGLGDLSTGYVGDDAGSRDGNLYLLLGRPDGWPAGVSDIRDAADGWWTDESGDLPFHDHIPGADLDGDGHGDLILVTDEPDVGVGWRPYFGGSGGLPYGADVEALDLALTGTTNGNSVSYHQNAVLHDLDGDGADEILVDDPNHVDGRGSVLVVEGESLLAGLAAIEDVGSYAYFIDPDAEGGGAGYPAQATRLADDIDGDGNPEIALVHGFSDSTDGGLICTSLVLGGQIPEGELSAREHARVCPPDAAGRDDNAWAYTTDWIPDMDGDGLSDLYVFWDNGNDSRDIRRCILRTSEIAAGGVYDNYEPENLCFWGEDEQDPVFSDLTGDGLPEWIFSDDTYDDPTYGENAGRIMIMEGFDIPFDDPSKW